MSKVKNYVEACRLRSNLFPPPFEDGGLEFRVTDDGKIEINFQRGTLVGYIQNTDALIAWIKNVFEEEEDD